MIEQLEEHISTLYKMVGELKNAEMLNVVERTLMARCVASVKYSKNRLIDLQKFLESGDVPENFEPRKVKNEK